MGIFSSQIQMKTPFAYFRHSWIYSNLSFNTGNKRNDCKVTWLVKTKELEKLIRIVILFNELQEDCISINQSKISDLTPDAPHCFWEPNEVSFFVGYLLVLIGVETSSELMRSFDECAREKLSQERKRMQ